VSYSGQNISELSCILFDTGLLKSMNINELDLFFLFLQFGYTNIKCTFSRNCSYFPLNEKRPTMATSKPKNTPTYLPYATSLGQMYRRFVLDCIPDLGYAVSQDFFLNPQMYQAVRPDTAISMATVQASMGIHADLPNKKYRAMLYKPIFGTSDATGTGNDGSVYQAGRLKLIASAVAFAERTVTSGQLAIRSQVLSAIVPLQHHFTNLVGASSDQSSHRINMIHDTSLAILTDPAVSNAFGVSTPADPGFSNAEAAKLVERISQKLQDLMPSGPMTGLQYSGLIEMANNGEKAIQLILDPNVRDNIEKSNELIIKLYAWGSDLGLIGGAISRV
jgi:hypothetical protein